MTQPDPAPESAPAFTAATIAALREVGRQVAIDWDEETFEVAVPGAPSIAGAVLRPANAVALYAMWDDPVPSPRREEVALWTARTNTDLTTCTLEFSLDTGILAVRAVVTIGRVAVGTPGVDIPEEAVAISRRALGTLLAAAVDDAASVFARLAEPLAALIA